ncbi:acyltransferase [Ligilactobacillus agilis]|uniref:Acyltransferase n=2 Tax=Ligilactobacillus agilis TaxID=1601 RepID=A0A231QE28_9LACO|nr:alpha/beta hydrolase [Ligilactobacillus agilis]MBL1056553.1 alpha/beta hydrolase [Ligilactobacillus agilis]MCI5761117.1 alpha/beta hydrolase [Ligilactobacillus agilis]OXC06998.1 acyltransferase [Ligilactobacillus agilis]OXC08315.1 acyltransferase [Ligilactobacillus agilis]OXC09197.1 acyltransferase [Ligilactobacillus agilis]
MRRRKNIASLLFSLLLILALAWPAYFWTKDNVANLTKWHNSKLSPIIMIPGSSATENRFDSLVSLINKQSFKKHSLLKVKVWNSGKITYQGKINPKDNEPFIVVGFENNHDGYDNILKQAKMFNKAFTALTNRYDFNNFKGIGHSNGGLVYTAFLEKYFNEDDAQIKKLMTIGSPFNFAEKSTANKTQMLASFIKNKVNLPSNLIVYSVAGTQNYESDGLVPLDSVEAGKYVYQNQVKSFTEITVTGVDAQHSSLPQNKQIVSLITEYILDKHTLDGKGKLNTSPNQSDNRN